MVLHMYLIWLFCLLGEGSEGLIVITQTPLVSAFPGEPVSFQCKADSNVNDEMNVYLFRSGEVPKPIMYHATNHFPGVPDRFRGSGRGTDFTFSISHFHAEDAGEYFCGHDYGYDLTQ
ncbi:unnamed protein product [Eretmochelys imbricata]